MIACMFPSPPHEVYAISGRPVGDLLLILTKEFNLSKEVFGETSGYVSGCSIIQISRSAIFPQLNGSPLSVYLSYVQAFETGLGSAHFKKWIVKPYKRALVFWPF